ncbi:MAG: general secretion pathway protein GspB [Nitrospirae bacterium]|nr:general secretion pathway protein GspB [Nitrospirota bacterium]
MSFILDALKKIEQKRQRGSVPDLMTVHIPAPEEQRKRPVWQYLVLAALILNAGILAVWLLPRDRGNQNTTAQTAADQQHETTAAETKTNKSIVTEKVSDKIFDTHSSSVKAAKEKPAREVNTAASGKQNVASKTVKQEQQSTAKATKQESKPEDQAPPLPAVDAITPPKKVASMKLPKAAATETLRKQSPKTIPALQEPQQPDTNKTASTNSIPELSQLPQNVQGELPKLSILGHIYSNSSDTRMVNVNGDILREGDTVAKNLTIKEITETGVVFNYSGTLFRVRAF